MVPEKLAKEERDAAIYLATWDLRYGTLCKDDFHTYLRAILFFLYLYFLIRNNRV
jgi:hypothetical protein